MPKYNIDDFGSALIGWRDEGTDEEKILRIGFDINSISGFYGFMTAIMRFDNTSESYGSSTDPTELIGISMDRFGAYSKDSFNVKVHLPVTLRLSDDENDDSYMSYDIKASYSLDSVSPYFRIQQDTGMVFNDELKVAPQFNLGMEWVMMEDGLI